MSAADCVLQLVEARRVMLAQARDARADATKGHAVRGQHQRVGGQCHKALERRQEPRDGIAIAYQAGAQVTEGQMLVKVKAEEQ